MGLFVDTSPCSCDYYREEWGQRREVGLRNISEVELAGFGGQLDDGRRSKIREEEALG